MNSELGLDLIQVPYQNISKEAVVLELQLQIKFKKTTVAQTSMNRSDSSGAEDMRAVLNNSDVPNKAAVRVHVSLESQTCVWFTTTAACYSLMDLRAQIKHNGSILNEKISTHVFARWVGLGGTAVSNSVCLVKTLK